MARKLTNWNKQNTVRPLTNWNEKRESAAAPTSQPAPTSQSAPRQTAGRGSTNRDEYDSNVRSSYASRRLNTGTELDQMWEDHQLRGVELNSAAANLSGMETELEQLRKLYEASPNAVTAARYNSALEKYNQSRIQYNIDVAVYNRNAEKIYEQMRPATAAELAEEHAQIEPQYQEARKNWIGSAINAVGETLLSANAGGVIPGRSTGGAYAQAAEDYDTYAPLASRRNQIAGQYSYVNAQEQIASMPENVAERFYFANAMQADMEEIMHRVTDTEYRSDDQGNLEYINQLAAKYRLGDIGSTDLMDLYDQMNRIQQGIATEITNAGYDYATMSNYEKTKRDAAKAAQRETELREYASESPFWASAETVVGSALQGAEYIGKLVSNIGHNNAGDLGSYIPMNTYDMNVTNFVSTIRDEVSKDIEENTNWELFDQNVASFLYNTGMSIADCATQIAVFGKGALLLMGMSAAANQTKNVIERGGSNAQALWSGLAAGAAEAIFEKFSVDKLLKIKNISSLKRALSATFTQSGVECSEEMLTEIANILSDAIIMGNDSDFANAVAAYMEKGKSREDAQKQAFLDCIGRVAWAGAAGAVSGFAMGGSVSTIAYEQEKTKNRDTGAAIRDAARAGAANYDARTGEVILPTAEQTAGEAGQTQYDAVEKAIETGLKSAAGTDSRLYAEQAQRKVESGEKLTNTELGRLARANEEAIEAEAREAFMNTSEVTPTVDENGNTVLPTFEQYREDIRQKVLLRRANELRQSMKARGITGVEITELPQGSYARFDKETGVVQVSPYVPNDYVLQVKMGHEIAHAATLGDKKFVEHMLGVMKENNFDTATMHKNIERRYREFYKRNPNIKGAAFGLKQLDSNPEEFTGEEIVGDFIGDVVGDNNLLDQVAKSGVAGTFLNAVDSLVNTFGGESHLAYRALARRLRAAVAANEHTLKAAAVKANEKAEKEKKHFERATEREATKEEVTDIETELVAIDGQGTPVALQTADGHTVYSLSTFEESGRDILQAYLDKQVDAKEMTRKDADDILESMDAIYDVCNGFKDKYGSFGEWSEAKVVTDAEGSPIFSVVKANGEYVMNLDFSLICKKRRTLNAVFNEMIQRGMMDNFDLSQEAVVEINNIIREHGFEVACALCFVDAKRFRVAKVADDFVKIYNSLVKSMAKGAAVDSFNFANAPIEKVDGGIDTVDDSQLDFSRIDAIIRNVEERDGEKNVNYKVAKYLKEHPEGRKLLHRSDFMTDVGFENVQKDAPEVLKLYNAKKGSGGPKAAFGDVQYLSDIIQSRKFDAEKAYAVGGVRIQSFSDYVARLVFDYVQMIGDLAAKQLPAHAYTKEALFVKQFGLTGIKINMSLIPRVEKGGVAPGLDAEGNYVWADESFDYDTAIEIQNAEGYSANCGTIAVGVSDEHIRMLMEDEDIRMVIPYHKSGLNPIVARMNAIDKFEDYTNSQNTRYSDGKKLSKEDMAEVPEFNQLLRETGDPRAAAEEYVRWCEEHDYLPKFDQFAYQMIDGVYVEEDGKRVVNPNYYKLLIDFAVYDNGQYTPQGAVKAVFPTESNAFGSMKTLIEEGLKEDQDLTDRRNAEVGGIVDEIEAKWSYSVDPTDAEYMAAVERGDMETAQRMVDEAAKAAGHNIKLYHGTAGEPFYVFRQGAEGIHFGTIAQATRRAEIAQQRYESRFVTYHADDIRSNPGKYPDGARRSIIDYIVTTLPVDFSQEEIDSAYDLIESNAPISDSVLFEYLDRAERECGAKTYRLSNTAMQKAGDSRVIPAYVKAQSPMIFDVDIGEWIPANLAAILIDKINGQTTQIYDPRAEEWVSYDPKNIQGIDLTEEDIFQLERLQNYYSMEFEEMAKFLQSKGVDSIRYLNTYEGTGDEESYILLSREQVKSAEPVTYDDDGNVIPLSERFNEESGDIRYSLDPVDREYMAAVKNNNKSAQERMVREEARKNFYDTPKLYRGTENATRTILDPDKAGGAIYATPSLKAAMTYSKGSTKMNLSRWRALWGLPNKNGIYELYGKTIGKKLVIDAEGHAWNDLRAPELGIRGITSTRAIAEAAREQGYKTVIIKNCRHSRDPKTFDEPTDIYIFFEAERIKSAAPVTYDDFGRVIPLSKRFNSSKKDLRYSINPEWENEYSNWAQRGRHGGATLKVGTVSEPILSVLEEGVRPKYEGKGIVWYATKINSIQEKHPEMTDGVILQVPYILERPVLIMESRTYPNRLTMFGEVYDDLGVPVMAVVDLVPRDSGEELEVENIVIVNSYVRTTPAGQEDPAMRRREEDLKVMNSFINQSRILYVDPNKERTDNWLTLNRVQFPLGQLLVYGPIDTISLVPRNVNGVFSAGDMSFGMQDWQKKLLEAYSKSEEDSGGEWRNSVDFLDSLTDAPAEEDLTLDEMREELDQLAALTQETANPIGRQKTDPTTMVDSNMPKAKKGLRETADDAYGFIIRKMVDAGDTVNRVGKAVGDQHLYQYYNMARASTGAATSMIMDAQTNIRGEKIGKSLNEIFDPIREKGDEYYNAFQLYLLHMHNIDRMSRRSETTVEIAREQFEQFRRQHPELNGYADYQIMDMAEDQDSLYYYEAREYAQLIKAMRRAENTRNKPVFGYDVSAEDSQGTADQLLRDHPEFAELAKEVYGYIDGLLQYRVESGLLTPEDVGMLKSVYPHYVPTYRLTEREMSAQALTKSVQVGKTIKRADGSEANLMPLHTALAKQTMSVVREGSKNRFGQRLLRSGAERNPDAMRHVQNIEEVEANFHEDTFDELEDSAPKKTNTFIVRADGKLMEIQVSPELFEGIKALSPDPEVQSVITKVVRGANNLFKALVTGYNPTFVVRNFARDLQDAGLYSKDLSEFVKEYPEAVKEIATNGEYWQMFKALGGTYSSIFDYATGNVERGNWLKRNTIGRIEGLNMAIEQAPRLAEFMATVKNGDGSMENLMEALYNAADVTVNFGRSGTWGKYLNANWVPFLNPGIQGFSKMIRSVTETRGAKNWARLALKAAMFGIAPSLLNALLYSDDEEWDQLKERDKDVYYLFKIKDGLWLKLPKGRTVSLLGMAADRTVDMIRGEDVDWGGVISTAATQVAPANPLESNILKAWMDADLFDKDSPGQTWYGSDIESQRLQNYAPGERYDERTDEVSKWLGGKLGLSPKKINYLLDSYTGVVGDIVLPLLTPRAERDMFTAAFTLDSVNSNRMSEDFYEKLDELTFAKNGPEAVGTDAVTHRFWNKQAGLVSDVNAAIREIETNGELTNAEKKDLARVQYQIRNELEQNALDKLEAYEAAAAKYYNAAPMAKEEDRIDYAYLMANREVMGAEYALRVYNTDVYNTARSMNAMGIDYEDFFSAYFDMKDSKEGLTGAAASNAERDALMNAQLTEPAKILMYREYISKTRDDDIKAFLDADMSFDQFLSTQNAYAQINEEYDKAKDKSTAFSRWVYGQSMTADQMDVAREAFTYFNQVPANAERYEEMIDAGMSDAAVTEILSGIDELEPEEGYTSVRDVQKYMAIAHSPVSELEKEIALEAYMGESAFAKYTAARDAGIDTMTYVKFLDATGDMSSTTNIRGETVSRKEKVMNYIDSLPLSDAKKDALYYAAGYKASTIGEAPWRGGSSSTTSSSKLTNWN